MNIPGESRRTCLSTIFGVWCVILVYATIHDQYLIRIHPDHFLLWHYHISFTSDYTLLALIYAFGASVTPGLLLGVCLYVSGRLFDLPKKSVRYILTGTASVAITTEALSLLAGLCAFLRRKGIYPSDLYPDNTVGMGITQSIQITAYLAGGLLSLTLILWIWRSRIREKRAHQGAAATA
jgi:hypothetical protein